ncbi:UbiD family decarboxylase, partial [Alteribacillus persepolensis]
MAEMVEANMNRKSQTENKPIQTNLAKRKVADLQGIVEFLRQENMLVRTKSPVDIKHEMAGIANNYEGGKAVFFENINESEVPLLTGLYWNRKLLAKILDVTEKKLPFLTAQAIEQWSKHPVDPVVVDQGPANEVVVEDKEDLLRDIPIPTHGLKDGGPYLDSSVLI